MSLALAPTTMPQPVERRASSRTPYGMVPLPRFAGEDKRVLIGAEGILPCREAAGEGDRPRRASKDARLSTGYEAGGGGGRFAARRWTLGYVGMTSRLNCP